MNKADTQYELYQGVMIPGIGFGTWQIPDGYTAYDAVRRALAVGYRHIDNAFAYGNGKSVGQAIKDSGIPREQLFLTSKLPADIKRYDEVIKTFHETLKQLECNYLDLYLIHGPCPWGMDSQNFRKENREAWSAIEAIYRAGLVRSIGVSNFSVEDLDSLMDECSIIPMVNQICFHVGNVPHQTIHYCQKNRILVEGYSPLATGRILNHPKLIEISKRCRVSVAQLCIRYVHKRGGIPLPKTIHHEYMEENRSLDFEISEEIMEELDGIKQI